MNIIKRIEEKIRRTFMSREAYARRLGVKIGNNCFINSENWGSEPYLITVGNNVQITDNVIFHTHGGAHVARRIYPKFDVFGKIVIEDWAYIGSGTHIMPGVTIGEGSLIAAGSVVTKSVPKGELWGGVPAKRISTIEDYIKKNIRYNTNTKDYNPIIKRRILLDLPDDKFIKK